MSKKKREKERDRETERERESLIPTGIVVFHSVSFGLECLLFVVALVIAPGKTREAPLAL